MVVLSELFLPLFLLCALTGCMGSGDVADRNKNHDLSQFIDAPTVQKASKAVAGYHQLDGVDRVGGRFLPHECADLSI